MKWLKAPEFWGGVLVGYLLVVAFPAINVRVAGIRGGVGKA